MLVASAKGVLRPLVMVEYGTGFLTSLKPYTRFPAPYSATRHAENDQPKVKAEAR